MYILYPSTTGQNTMLPYPFSQNLSCIMSSSSSFISNQKREPELSIQLFH